MIRKVLFTGLWILCPILSAAQINPPKQTDTLYITSLKYNHMEVEEEDWPCEVIYRSSKDFRIGEKTFNILDFNKWGNNIHYSIINPNDSKGNVMDLWITTGNKKKVSMILFGGYEFSCSTNRVLPVENSFAKPAVMSYTLDGRDALHLDFPEFHCSTDGEVHVLIHVDRSGRVISAKVIDDLSSKSQCLRFFAVRAASSSIFSPLKDASPAQAGEITYRFLTKK